MPAYNEPSPPHRRAPTSDTSTSVLRWPSKPPNLRLLPRRVGPLGDSSEAATVLVPSQSVARRYILMRCDCPRAAENDGCIRRVVIARHRTSGAVRRLHLVCRVSPRGPDEPPDTDPDPDPDPDPPSAPHALAPRESPLLALGTARRQAA